MRLITNKKKIITEKNSFTFHVIIAAYKTCVITNYISSCEKTFYHKLMLHAIYCNKQNKKETEIKSSGH